VNLIEFKEFFMINPIQTIIINRTFEIDGAQNHLLALTYDIDSYSLWVVDVIPEIKDDLIPVDLLSQTNRDQLERTVQPEIRLIESIEIGNDIIGFSGYSAEPIRLNQNQGIHKLQYFLERGIDLKQLDQIDLSRIRLIRHTSSTPTDRLDIENIDKNIKLNLRAYRKNAEVFNQYKVPFDLSHPFELKYFNPFEDRVESFYVHKFETYDYQDYIKSLEEHEIPHGFEAHFQKMRTDMATYFEALKSKKSSLVLMTYEATDGLSFLSTAYLNKRVDPPQSANGASSIGLIFLPKEKIGDHSMKLFIASFQEVPNDRLDQFEFELHTIYKQIEAVSICL